MTVAPSPALPAALLRAPIAHRALHDRTVGRIENSLSAVAAAVEAGYGIEIDVQLSADGVPMVFHDEDLDRLTHATGRIHARRASDLTTLPLRDSSDTIPTLAQVLALVAGRVPLLVEIKDQTDAMAPTDGRLEAATVAALAGYPGPVALMSFNPHCIAAVARLAPHLPRGLTTAAYEPAVWAPLPAATCDRLREIPDFEATGASFVSHEWSDLARPRVREIARGGAAVLSWTIRSPETEARARQLSDNVTFEGYAAALPA